MSTQFKTYSPEPLFGDDYEKLRDFLIKLDSHNYHFGRWDWMITHSMLDKNGLSKIGFWEDNGVIVAAATYDCCLGKAYLLTLNGYAWLKEEMLRKVWRAYSGWRHGTAGHRRSPWLLCHR
jgi:hypothetical protein